MADISPGPENDYQATPTLTFSREVWNVVMASISARLKARELLEATFEAMIEDGTQAALDLISTNVAPQLSELSTQITSLQGQLEDLLDAGTAPNALQLGGEDPAFYLSLANATGTLPVAKVEGIDASIATAIDALTDGAPSALDTLKEISDALGDDADFAGTMMTALAARLVKANNLSDLPDAVEARTNLGLKSAATKDVGTAAGNVVQLDGSGKLPAVDASQVTGLGTAAKKNAGTGAGNVLLLATANKLPALDGSALTGVIPPHSTDVGAYVFATANTTTVFSVGSVVAGSSLKPGGVGSISAGWTLPGTWVCQGNSNTNGEPVTAATPSTLYKRIA